MKKIFYSVLFISTFIFSSCVGDLDQFPHKETMYMQKPPITKPY